VNHTVACSSIFKNTNIFKQKFEEIVQRQTAMYALTRPTLHLYNFYTVVFKNFNFFKIISVTIGSAVYWSRFLKILFFFKNW